MRIFAVVFLLALTACASMTQPQTVREGIIVAAEQAAATVETANELYVSNVISKEQHARVLEEAIAVDNMLDEAELLLKAGEGMEARDRLTLANRTLVSLRDELKEAQDE